MGRRGDFTLKKPPASENLQAARPWAAQHVKGVQRVLTGRHPGPKPHYLGSRHGQVGSKGAERRPLLDLWPASWAQSDTLLCHTYWLPCSFPKM